MCGSHYMSWRQRRTPEEIAATLNRTARIEQFRETGLTVCQRHGLHGDWSLRLKKHPRGDYHGLMCRACNRENARAWTAKHPGQKTYYTSVRGKANGLVQGARHRAAQSGMAYGITIDWVVERYEAQDGRCAFTGAAFDNTVTGRGYGRNFHGMSLDREDPLQGYTIENTRLVCWGVNQAKGVLSMPEFVAMCKAVAATLG